MTHRDDDRRDTQDFAHQGMADLGYGYGTGDYGFHEFARRPMNAERDGRSRPNETAPASHAGKGPRGYVPNDERIREDVIHALTDHGDIDATDLEVRVERGEVYLYGNAPDRRQKRLAADVAFDTRGVLDVYNSIRTRAAGTSGEVSSSTGHARLGNEGPGDS